MEIRGFNTHLFFGFLLALGVSATAQPPSESAWQKAEREQAERHRIWAEAIKRKQQFLGCPVPPAKVIVWNATLESGDIWGVGDYAPMHFWLDQQGQTWVQSLDTVVGLQISEQQELLRKEGTLRANSPGVVDLLLESLSASGDDLKSLHFTEVVQAWSKIPSPIQGCPGATSFHLGTDYYGWFTLKSPNLQVREYKERGYALALAESLAKCLGDPKPQADCAGTVCGGSFEAYLSGWIQQVQDALKSRWVEQNCSNDFKGVISDEWIRRSGPRMLQSAFMQNKELLAESLVRRGVALDLQTDEGSYPFFQAFQSGTPAFVSKLLMMGAKPSLKGRDGFSALHSAAENSKDPVSVIRLLLQTGIKANGPDSFWCSPLHLAVRGDEHAVGTARILLENGANPNTLEKVDDPAELGKPPLAYALWHSTSSQELVRLMLDHGADPDFRDTKGQNALSYVRFESGNESIIKLMLERGANPRVADSEGNTPLHRLARQTDAPLSIAKAFVVHGASTSAKNNAGLTPFDLARSKDHSDLADWLEKIAHEERAHALEVPNPSLHPDPKAGH